MIAVNGPAVVADDVSIEYRSGRGTDAIRAVDGVSLTVRQGEILAVLGESGSGKSTFAAAIAGQLGATGEGEGAHRRHIVGGELTVLGQKTRGLRTTSRKAERLSGRIGYLPQDGADRLSPDLTVGEAIAEPIYMRDRRFDRKEAGLIVARLVDAVHLPLGVMRLNTWELSSGQRQRVALARALVLEPQLLVADEPARGVDVLVRQSVLEALATLQRNRQFSAVVVSSDLREARALADRVAIMAESRLVGLGTFDEVLDNPVDPYVKTLAATAARPVKRRPATAAAPRRSSAPRRPVSAGTGPRSERQENA
ncbi:ATP-binding cassette domain-containing protein [Curtobacterium sp. MCPF17_002]|jgi:peptide/nickel transport system ATP-binding protein|uniref:ATP-binding cassette domain-containing protein n=1 Tax=Curtobacterium sp. MCPF17_002 TaxID=2175645 RepID=UPI000DAAA288|nr:ATP-binding cassette domain-containing protein [Curtobacterium sp. MCPF17_002]WIB78970.1 ATP-binding cassette domain-containing protein [Curtobacterium sp. MCPF17_002]